MCDYSGVNALFLPSGGLWCEPAPSATLALISKMAFVPRLATYTGWYFFSHTTPKQTADHPEQPKEKREVQKQPVTITYQLFPHPDQ